MAKQVKNPCREVTFNPEHRYDHLVLKLFESAGGRSGLPKKCLLAGFITLIQNGVITKEMMQKAGITEEEVLACAPSSIGEVGVKVVTQQSEPEKEPEKEIEQQVIDPIDDDLAGL